MRAEYLKIRSMPTPFWCAAAVVLFFIGGLTATSVWGAGEDLAAIEIGVTFPLAIASVVLGVWIVGVEYGQNTLRRTLSGDPARGRLIRSKLVAACSVVLGATLFFNLLALLLYGLANSGHGTDFPVEDVVRIAANALLVNTVYVLVGAAFALITASMAGGMTAALVFIFVIDGMLSLIPTVGDYTFGLAMSNLSSAITGTDGDFLAAGSDHPVVVSALVAAGWLVILLALGSQRLIRDDVK